MQDAFSSLPQRTQAVSRNIRTHSFHWAPDDKEIVEGAICPIPSAGFLQSIVLLTCVTSESSSFGGVDLEAHRLLDYNSMLVATSLA